MQSAFDDAMCWSLDQMRRLELSVDHWYEIYKGMLGGIVDEPKFAKIVAANGDWASVLSELEVVCAESRLGKRAFGHGLTLVAGQRMAQVINEGLQGLATEGKPLQYEELMEFYKSVTAFANSSAAGSMSTKRTIVCDYRSLTLEIPVVNFQEELHCDQSQ